MLAHNKSIAIIGAGLGGCALALALSSENINICLYEARPAASHEIKSGVILTPNGLQVLDRLGVLARIKDKCYIQTHRTVKNDKDETIRKALIADESLYGYRNHRVWRRVLLDEMRLMLKERAVPIRYDSKFNGILGEDEMSVSFKVNDSVEQASLLVGCDGIHSSVRKAIAGDISPQYTGVLGVISHIQRTSIAWPAEDFERNATLQGEHGAIFFMSEDPDSTTLMVGTHVHYEEKSRADLAVLQADKDQLADFFQRMREGSSPTAKQIIDEVRREKAGIWIWPYMKMPLIPRWYSPIGRVVICGDSAHALPPSSGQGVNQALEDAHSLALVLASLADRDDRDQRHKSGDLLRLLPLWQQVRQERIDTIFDWVQQSQNVDRLPAAERRKLESAGRKPVSDDMSWLYAPRIEKDVRWCFENARVS